MPKALTDEYWQQVTQFQKEKSMPYVSTPERIAMERFYPKRIETVLRLRFPEASEQLISEFRQHDPDYALIGKDLRRRLNGDQSR